MDEIAKTHHAVRDWDRVMAQIRAEMMGRRVQATQTVVLLPYAQLMRPAKSAWLRGLEDPFGGAHFLPRFETTMNWCKSLGAPTAAHDDLKLDAARDILTAASLLQRAGLKEQLKLLAPRLMQAARSLAKLAAAVPPAERLQWGSQIGKVLEQGQDAPALAYEVAMGRIALAWAASSNYPTDAVFQASPSLLVILEGFQAEPMALKLQERGPHRVLRIPLSQAAADSDSNAVGTIRLHAAQDAEDEALRAAACVIQHFRAGRTPVALVAQDRLLTRRVHAMLSGQGVQVIDETGWKLSTTRAAARLMGLLRAIAWDAGCDDVLDFLKNAPAFDQTGVTQLESVLRQQGGGRWRDALWPKDQPTPVVHQMQALRDGLKTGRHLSQWLNDLRAALEHTGLGSVLEKDAAGQRVIEALRLSPGCELEFEDFGQRMSPGELQAWVNQTLEASSFSPTPPASDQAVPALQLHILPMSQLLGRPMAAVVFPGCDELRLPVSPEPDDPWTPGQRSDLGLPARDLLNLAQRQAWAYTLQFPQLDVLWRQSEAGEKLMPSPLVQALRLRIPTQLAANPTHPRQLTAQPCAMPQVKGDRLAPVKLSSSAYEDLRRCPYRFFALQQLKLKEANEIDTPVDSRDVGIWLHQVLKEFHETLQASPITDPQGRRDLINACAQKARQALGLPEADFLPFVAAWPRLREGYLKWLEGHERAGAQFLHAESRKELPLAHLKLVGVIDRVDRLSDGSLLVIDYKTESSAVTAQRIKSGLEDTQLAFYAALLPDDSLSGAYLNVSEGTGGKEASKTYLQNELVEMRDELIQGIVQDMQQISQGVLLKALGEAKACEYCAARGLCRKDFWEQAP